MADDKDTEAIDMRPLLDDGDPLRVRYTGSANERTISRSDLSGEGQGGWQILLWTPGAEIDYKYWLEMAGSEDRARAVLKAHKHEFDLVGAGADEFWASDEAEEFSVEGPAA